MPAEPPSHYATLGLDRDCSDEQIRTAYRALARLHHPDLNRGAPEAVAQTQALNAAYEILADPQRRQAYDGELLRAARGPTARRAAVTPITMAVHLTTLELLRGAVLVVQVRDPAHPQGAEALELVVPPDTAPGTSFRLQRAPPFEHGSVRVRVKVRPDARFKPRGSDLRCDLRISAQRAAQGGVETVRGVTGQLLRVAVPPRVARGEVVRIPGEGLPRPRGGRGDLLVRILYRIDVRVAPLQR